MRYAGALALLVVGAATALATVAVHEIWWGLLLGAAATLAALLGLRPGGTTRLPFGTGWSAFVLWVSRPRPEGDFAVSSDGPGLTLLALAVVVMVVAIGTLPRPRRVPPGGVGDRS